MTKAIALKRATPPANSTARKTISKRKSPKTSPICDICKVESIGIPACPISDTGKCLACTFEKQSLRVYRIQCKARKALKTGKVEFLEEEEWLILCDVCGFQSDCLNFHPLPCSQCGFTYCLGCTGLGGARCQGCNPN
jgi:hypothetical protein